MVRSAAFRSYSTTEVGTTLKRAPSVAAALAMWARDPRTHRSSHTAACAVTQHRGSRDKRILGFSGQSGQLNYQALGWAENPVSNNKVESNWERYPVSTSGPHNTHILSPPPRQQRDNMSQLEFILRKQEWVIIRKLIPSFILLRAKERARVVITTYAYAETVSKTSVDDLSFSLTCDF